MRFDLHCLRLHFKALDPIHFPDGKAANILRGALGMHLAPGIFRPVSASGPSGLSNPPRPFVLRTRTLEGRSFQPGEPFSPDVHVFSSDAAFVQAFVDAFREAAGEGIGPGRGKASIEEVQTQSISIDLAAVRKAERVRIRFLTPTELKYDDGIAESPEFPILFARIRDRVATLRSLYGAGVPEIDFASMVKRAADIRMTDFESSHTSRMRRSTRTGMTHPIGGFTGSAAYEGPLGEFWSWLEAAQWTGVGRQAVWGKGEISLTPI